MKPDPLHRLLRDWSARHQPDAEILDQLASHVSVQARSPAGATPAHDLQAQGWARPVLGRFAYATLGVAAAVVAAVGLRIGSTIPDPEAQPEAGWTAEKSELLLSPVQLASARQLFSEIDGTFCNGLAWLAETDNDIALGVGDRTGASALGAGPLVLVRTLVLERTPGAVAWTPVWRASVVTRPEEVVRLEPARPKARMFLWACPVNGDAIAVDSSIELDAPTSVTASSTQILLAGKPVRIQSVRTPAGEYRVMQMAVLLPSAGGRS